MSLHCQTEIYLARLRQLENVDLLCQLHNSVEGGLSSDRKWVSDFCTFRDIDLCRCFSRLPKSRTISLFTFGVIPAMAFLTSLSHANSGILFGTFSDMFFCKLFGRVHGSNYHIALFSQPCCQLRLDCLEATTASSAKPSPKHQAWRPRLVSSFGAVNSL